MEYYRLPLYIVFGILPSLIWLSYYLKKDLHPEPKRMILKIFLYGAAITVPLLFLQIGLSELLEQLKALGFFNNFEILADILDWFFIIALTEEIAKYLVVRMNVLNNHELDEPLDIMLYMVVSALGFAALENVLYMFSPLYSSFNEVFAATITISLVRFIGATFLHTLASAILGYFLAKSLYSHKERRKFVVIGISLATLLHGFYNFSIMTLENFMIPILILFALAIFVIYDFDEVKKLKGICKISKILNPKP